MDEITQNRTLLLVDDEDGILSALNRSFRTEGYKIFKASSGKEGLALLSEYSIGVIVSDQRMPEMTGVEFLSEVKKRYPNTIRIILSGYTDLKSILDAINKGAVYKFITKPWDDNILKSHVRKSFELFEMKEENIRLTKELRYANEALSEVNEFLMKYDPLTGLPNQQMLSERVDKLISNNIEGSEETWLGLLIIKINGFKKIDEVFGHDIVNKIAEQIAGRLKKIIKQDTFVSCLNVNEFAVFIEKGLDTNETYKLAEKILNDVTRNYSVKGNDYVVSANIGISSFPGDGKSMAELLKNAKTAMNRAKENAVNTFQYYSHEMSKRAVSRLSLEASMRKAFENKEFTLHYQPQIYINSCQIRSAEALVRWESPVEGLIAPDKFIPCLEDTGLIVPVGEMIISEAIKAQQDFKKIENGPELISINLSGRQFKSKGLVKHIINLVDSSGLTGNNIEFEITESVLMDNINETIKILSELKELGVKIAVDDFGTGYSSLSYLKLLPIDILKLDMSFVKDIDESTDSLAISSAVISLGHDLGLKVIAEGVETQKQLSILEAKKCDIIQGYFFSKPLPYEQMKTFCIQSNSKFEQLKISQGREHAV